MTTRKHRGRQQPEIAGGVNASRVGNVTLAEAGWHAASLAEKASKSGTFGVGGLLLERGGKVLAEAMNAVMVNGTITDPTAHVERQLVDWYFKNRESLGLPGTAELMIVSSLDPCAMCAGAILKSGLKAVSIARDAGVGIKEHGIPIISERESRDNLEAHFDQFPAAEHGSAGAEILKRCKSAFDDSFRKIRSGFMQEKAGMETAELRRLLRRSRHELPAGLELPPEDLDTVFGADKRRLGSLLSGGKACMIDQEGRPILVAGGAEEESPIRDSVLELIRGYTYLGNELRQAGINLPPKAETSILKQKGPESTEDALLQLGALGSFMEQPGGARRLPLLVYLEGNEAEINRFISAMPPYYSEHVGLTAGVLPSG